MDVPHTTDDFSSAAGCPLVIDWRIKNQILFTWEIESDALEKIVHPDLEIVEVRPGIALLTVSCLQYHEGNFGPGSPEFVEVVVVIGVQPDLSLDMSPPRFSFQAICVYSDSRDFYEQEGRTILTPTHWVPSLKVDFDSDGQGVRASNKDGEILWFRNSGPEPNYSETLLWGQHYNDTRGLNQGIFEWDGQRFEHMKRGPAGVVHAHPFFGDIDVRRITGCYRQMFMKPNTMAHERFYALKKLE